MLDEVELRVSDDRRIGLLVELDLFEHVAFESSVFLVFIALYDERVGELRGL